jgi:hypothetical protein
MQDEVKVGPFFFEYSAEQHEMYIGKGEEVLGMIEHVQEAEWAEFVSEATAPRRTGRIVHHDLEFDV